MKIALFIFSLVAFATTLFLAIYFEPKAAMEGKGFTIPLWPFVLALAFFMLIISILFERLADLIQLWLKTRVEIAKAENHVPEENPAEKPPEPEATPQPPAGPQ